jgi:hypothetical protein
MKMDLLNYLDRFLGTDTPFMLLFVSLFFYFMKSARDRERECNKIINNKLSMMEEEMQVLIRVWKILLEKELKKK